MACLDRCSDAWTSCLETALKRVIDSNRLDASVAKALVESINNIKELELPSLQNFLPTNEMTCRLSLLPPSAVPGKTSALHFNYYQNESFRLSDSPFNSSTNYFHCFHVGMKLIMWNGDHYFIKVANFWANRISSYPPQLSHTPIVKEQRSNNCPSYWLTCQTSDLIWWKHQKLL